MQHYRTRIPANVSVGLVPTMGALHEGHASLIRHARQTCDRVVLSVFVNPLQFGPNEDFDRYPRTFETDLALAKSLGVDAVFCPHAPDVYGTTHTTRVSAGPAGELYCGKTRPGFFTGVLTVVSVLFQLTRPHKAIFGEKDYQQLCLVKKMAADLHFPLKVVGLPIVREPSGLALSSRNRYLDTAQRQQALGLWKAINAVQSAQSAGENSAATLRELAKQTIENAGLELDYAELIDTTTLQPLPTTLAESTRLLLAAWVQSPTRTRLIDNAPVPLSCKA